MHRSRWRRPRVSSSVLLFTSVMIADLFIPDWLAIPDVDWLCHMLAFIAIWTTVWQDVRGGDYIDCTHKAGSNHVLQQQCGDQFRQSVQDRLSVTLTPVPTR